MAVSEFECILCGEDGPVWKRIEVDYTSYVKLSFWSNNTRVKHY